MEIDKAYSDLITLSWTDVNATLSRDSVKCLTQAVDVLKRIEELRRPEITRLICYSPVLAQQAWKYDYTFICSLVRVENSPDDLKQKLLLYLEEQTDDFFKEKIFPFGLSKVVESLSEIESEKQRDLETITQELQILRDTAEKYSEDIQKISEQLEQLTDDSEAEEREKLKKKLKRKKSYLNGREEKIATDEDQKSKIDEFLQRLNGLIQTASVIIETSKARENDDRTQVFKILRSSPEQNQLSEAVKSILRGEDYREIPKDYWKNEQFLLLLTEALCDADRPTAVHILSHLYNDGYVDVTEHPVDGFLIDSIPYIVEYQGDTLHTPNERPYANDLYNAVMQLCFDDPALRFKFFSCVRTSDLWRETWILLRSKFSLSWMIANAMVFCDNVSFSVFESCLGDLLAEPNADQDPVIDAIPKILQICASTGADSYTAIQRATRLVKTENKRRNKKISQFEKRQQEKREEIFGYLKKPIENLEKFITDCVANDHRIDAQTVASILKEVDMQLRDALHDLSGAVPLVDNDIWFSQVAVPFDRDIHFFPADTIPETVVLRTKGFQFEESDGECLTVPAIVGTVKPERKQGSGAPASAHKKHTKQTHPGNKNGSKATAGKQRKRKKNGRIKD